jgi:hypothetical protein
MSRTIRLPDALRGRKSLVLLGAAAATLATAGTANAATVASAAQSAAMTQLTAGPVTNPDAVSLGFTGSHGTVSLGGSAGSTSATPATAAPAAAPQPAPTPAQTTSAAVPSAPAQQAAHVQAAASSPHSQRAAASQQHAAAPAAPAPRPQYPYEIYDSVTPNLIPGNHVIATYATGPFAVPGSEVAGRPVLWIDTTGTDPQGASALDVEPGDATPASAATWVAQKMDANPHATAILYTMESDWPATQAAVATLPQWMQSHVRWWIADPTGVPHVVPGSNATQWYWGTNYDISTALPGF